MVTFNYKDKYGFDDLVEIVRLLRAPGGCPWDGEQTHQSIRRNFLEETCEVCEAIDEDDPAHLQEELGDVLLQVVFHAGIEQDCGRFDIGDVADGICKKLILRHPHVFGTTEVSGTEQVLTNWDAIKRAEKHQRTHADTLRAVAKTLPANWRADKLQSKAAKAGFAWPDAAGALDKLEEEVAELRQAVEHGTNVEEELGDVLFAAVNVGRMCGKDPEDALHGTCEKFIDRFAFAEAEAALRGKTLEQLTDEQLLELWHAAKSAPRRTT